MKKCINSLVFGRHILMYVISIMRKRSLFDCTSLLKEMLIEACTLRKKSASIGTGE